MLVSRVAYKCFSIGLKIARLTGLTKPLRRFATPLAARILTTAASPSKPTLVRGHQMVLASQSRYPPIDMVLDTYEKDTTLLVERILKPEMLFIDIGAHVGYYTLVAARQVGSQGTVHAFEPEPCNYELLVENIRLNDYTNITTHNLAVSSKSGPSNLFVSSLDSGRHSIYDHGLPKKDVVSVNSVAMDDFFESAGWPEADLIKIDVEGAENVVLKGMTGALQRSKILRLIIEFNPALMQSSGVDPVEFLGWPASNGLEVHIIGLESSLTALNEVDVRSLIAKLIKAQDSVNIYCHLK